MLIFLLVLQILSESLPLSSSGHLALFQNFLHVHGQDIHLPTALLWSVHAITAFLFILFLFDSWKLLFLHPYRTRRSIARLVVYGFCAEICTVILYALMLYIGCAQLPVWYGYVVLLGAYSSLSLAPQRERLVLSPFVCWSVLGIVQGIAAVPGISRMGIVYVIARWLGYSPRHAWSITITLAVPLFLVAGIAGFCVLDVKYQLMLFSNGVVLLAAAVGSAMLLSLTRWVMLHDRMIWFVPYIVVQIFFALQ